MLHYSTVGQKHTLTKFLGSGIMLGMRNDRFERFPWGKIVDEHEIGPYHFVEYKRFKSGSTKETKETTEFTIYIDGKDTHCGALSLDAALVLAVAIHNLGPHPEGMSLIGRALKVPL